MAADGADKGVGEQRRRSLVAGERPLVRAAVVSPMLTRPDILRTLEARLAEFTGLAQAIPLVLVHSESIRLKQIKPATYIGGGHVERIAALVEEEGLDLLLIDAQLSPIQQRNLERLTGAKVLDRTALILEIFGSRASTREGVLQVELAHLNYQKGRLVKSWTHLERQRGGGGFLGGPGETQIESDRRQLQERITLLEGRIDKVRRTRAVQRKPRRDAPYPVVAIVGYTNAGKSSLFNRLTGAEVMAKDQLFATLDTTVRRLNLPHGKIVMLSDTVGFIADLPTDLVAAFRATLEEALDADVVLHVRDISNPDNAAQAQDVLGVLNDLGISGDVVPVIEIHNKIDCVTPDNIEAAGRIVPAGSIFQSVATSAVTGQGIDELLVAIERALASGSQQFTLKVPHDKSDQIGWLYEHTEVLARAEPDELGTEFSVRVAPAHRAGFVDRFGAYLFETAAA